MNAFMRYVYNILWNETKYHETVEERDSNWMPLSPSFHAVATESRSNFS